MTSNAILPATVQPWAKLVAYAVPLCVLPSAAWRVALTAGLVGGGGHSWGAGERRYVLSLSVAMMSLALLTLGLVRPWGERVPGWVPVFGGRMIPARAVLVPAASGVFLLTLFFGYALLNYFFHFVPPFNDTGEVLPHDGREGLILQLCYGPLLAWPVLLGAVTLAYHRRRRA